MPGLVARRPGERAAREIGRILRIGQVIDERRIGEVPEFREVAAAPVAHRARQLRRQVAEEQEGLVGLPLLAHEEQRHRRRQQQDGDRAAQRFRLGQPA